MNPEITYTDSLAGITADPLRGGFFAGWPNPPTPATHLRILANSAAVELALAADGTVVGFITAISDGVSCAYIPFLEVLPAYQGQGIGTELVRRMLARLSRLYMVDLVCDDSLKPFYQRLGMHAFTSMGVRHHDRQSCEP
jgi:ribosomal protein S18 acetylase RimI-like enzyme